MILAEQFPIAGQYKDEITNIKIANVEEVLDSDIIIMGSPTYYGNVSGAMKSFIDSFSPCWPEAKLWGKKFFAFSTSANPEGGGDMLHLVLLCLLCLALTIYYKITIL